jgi:hypothetical protein
MDGWIGLTRLDIFVDSSFNKGVGLVKSYCIVAGGR